MCVSVSLCITAVALMPADSEKEEINNHPLISLKKNCKSWWYLTWLPPLLCWNLSKPQQHYTYTVVMELLICTWFKIFTGMIKTEMFYFSSLVPACTSTTLWLTFYYSITLFTPLIIIFIIAMLSFLLTPKMWKMKLWPVEYTLLALHLHNLCFFFLVPEPLVYQWNSVKPLASNTVLYFLSWMYHTNNTGTHS